MKAREASLPVIVIAAICHEANRRLCHALGDPSQVPFEDAPKWQVKSAVQGVNNILDGTVREPWDSHAAWMAHKQAEGWTYGPTKDPALKQHPCMVPFAELPQDQQLKDYLFLSIVEALSVAIPGGTAIGQAVET